MRSLKFLIVNFFVLVGIFATVQISNAQHSKTINIDERLFSRYDADYLNDMQINNPQELDYLNFILDNGYKISDLPGDKLGGIQQLYKLHPITGKAIKQALKNFDYENINIFEYDFEFPKSGIRYYRIGTDYKLITFFSEKKLRKDYEKSKSVVELQKSNMSVKDDDDLSFYMEIVATNPEPLSEEDGDTLKVCPSVGTTAGITEVMFNATAGMYSDNTAVNSTTTTFMWIFGDGSPMVAGVGMTYANHSYEQPGIYKVKVKGIDINDLNSTDTTIATRIIKVSTIPNFSGTNISEISVCTGTAIDLDGDVSFSEYTMAIDTLGGAGETFLPDGNGVSYTTVITHNAFENGQTLGNISDLEAICINMEHSYSGDFTIELTCPSGQTIELKHNDGGGTFLGEPFDGAPGDNPPTDDPSVNPPGIGYEYCWNHNPEFGTMTAEASGVSTLPVGSYQPTEPTGFAPLVGCELNGDWVITVTDLLSIDNGWIFYWSLFFNEDIIPTTGGDFLPTVEDTAQIWSWGDIADVSPNINTGYTNGDQTTAMPTLAGIEARIIPYIYTVTNDFGCSFDTTIYVFVMENAGGPCCEKPSVIISGAGETQQVCGSMFQLDVATPISGNNIGFWSYNDEIISLSNDSVVSPLVTTQVPGEHQFIWTEGTLNSNGQIIETCMDKDTLFVNFNLLPDANTESDTIYFCPQTDGDGNIIGELDGILTSGEQYECYWHGTGFNETNFLGEEDSIPNATFLAPAYGSYDLVFTESNGICTNSKKITTVFIRPPDAMAGSEENSTDIICQTDGSSNYELMASPLYSGETGTWACPEGTTFNDPGGINSAISNITAPSELGTYEFTWTITKDHCESDVDAINVTFVEDADAVANADAGGQSGSNVEVCGNVYVFNAIPANTGTGTWVTSELDNVAYSNLNSYESDVTIPNGAISAIEGFNEIKFLWIVDNDYCTAKDSINVKFYKEPISNAYIPFGYIATDIQENGYYDVYGETQQLNAQISLTNFVGQWSSNIPANVSYDDPSTETVETNANYIPNPIVSVTTNGQYTFTWTEKNEFYQTCESSSEVLIDFKELENTFSIFTEEDGLYQVNNAIEIPVSTTSLISDDGIYSYQFDYTYDEAKLEYTGYNFEGTISENGNFIEINSSVTGQLSVSYMTTILLTDLGDLIKLQFNTLAIGTSDLMISNFKFNETNVTNITNGHLEIVNPTTASITYSTAEIYPGTELLITATFSQGILDQSDVQISLSGENTLSATNMTKVSETVYTYTHSVTEGEGLVNIEIIGTDIYLFDIISPESSFEILPLMYGDVSDNGEITAYDAALTLLYSVEMNPMPTEAPLPWGLKRLLVANVDDVENIVAYDASLILQYSANMINTFPVENNKKNIANDNAGIYLSIENNEITLISTGNLKAFNLYLTGNTSDAVLGDPVFLTNQNLIAKQNITEDIYNIGMCSTMAFDENTELLKIPYYENNRGGFIEFKIIANNNSSIHTFGVTTDLENISSNKGISIFPNPAKDKLFVSGNIENANLKIYNLQGQLILEEVLTNDKIIDISKLALGFYTVKIQNKNDVFIEKLVKE